MTDEQRAKKKEYMKNNHGVYNVEAKDLLCHGFRFAGEEGRRRKD